VCGNGQKGKRAIKAAPEKTAVEMLEERRT